MLLGPSEAKVQKAYQSARRMLGSMGMDAYDLSDSVARKSGKVDVGDIYNGTDILGYRISGLARQPCAAACKKFLEKLDNVVKNAKREMKLAGDGTSRTYNARYHQSMVQLHKIVWGWSQSFRHTTAKHKFAQLDKEIDKRIQALEREMRHRGAADDPIARRRVIGVHLLADTAERPLPEV